MQSTYDLIKKARLILLDTTFQLFKYDLYFLKDFKEHSHHTTKQLNYFKKLAARHDYHIKKQNNNHSHKKSLTINIIKQ